MTVYLRDPDVTLYHGDALETLRTLPDESVHCVVTSPPYWGLRDYGTGLWEAPLTPKDGPLCPDCGFTHSDTAHAPDWTTCDHLMPPGGGVGATGLMQDGRSEQARQGNSERVVSDRRQQYRDVCGKCGARRVDNQMGLEPTPELYVQNMVAVFREVRRVLRRDGVCFLNIGDSYLPGKQMAGVPWRLLFALQDDGWIPRADIIWAKPNPMPESVTDRPTKAHEYVFLLTRSPRYYWDAEAVREKFSDNTHARGRAAYGEPGGKVAEPGQGIKSNTSFRAATWGQQGQAPSRPPQAETLDESLPPEAERGPDGRRATTVQAGNGSIQHRDGERWPNAGRNVRSVWEIATEPFPAAHFATFPTELACRCILAGTSERGCCPECEAPWVREVESERTDSRPGIDVKLRQITDGNAARTGRGGDYERQTLGWRPTCDCGEEAVIGQPGTTAYGPIPCTVLDPFAGACTVPLVARNHGRHAIGIELSETYLREIALPRLQQLSLFTGAT